MWNGHESAFWSAPTGHPLIWVVHNIWRYTKTDTYNLYTWLYIYLNCVFKCSFLKFHFWHFPLSVCPKINSITQLTSPINSLTTGTTPLSLVKPWYDIFLAALWVQINISPFIVSNPMYFISGRTQQFVCPNIVSGLRVAATKKIFFPFNPLRKKTHIYAKYVVDSIMTIWYFKKMKPQFFDKPTLIWMGMAQALSIWLKYIPEVQHPKQNKNLKEKRVGLKLLIYARDLIQISTMSSCIVRIILPSNEKTVSGVLTTWKPNV